MQHKKITPIIYTLSLNPEDDMLNGIKYIEMRKKVSVTELQLCNGKREIIGNHLINNIQLIYISELK